MLFDGFRAAVARAVRAEMDAAKLRALGYDPDGLPAILAGVASVDAGGPGRFADAVRQEVDRRAVAREARLRDELAALLAAGHLVDDLVIVTSPLYPDGVLMTRAQCDEHGVDLAAAVNRWAASWPG